MPRTREEITIQAQDCLRAERLMIEVLLDIRDKLETPTVINAPYIETMTHTMSHFDETPPVAPEKAKGGPKAVKNAKS